MNQFALAPKNLRDHALQPEHIAVTQSPYIGPTDKPYTALRESLASERNWRVLNIPSKHMRA